MYLVPNVAALGPGQGVSKLYRSLMPFGEPKMLSIPDGIHGMLRSKPWKKGEFPVEPETTWKVKDCKIDQIAIDLKNANWSSKPTSYEEQKPKIRWHLHMNLSLRWGPKWLKHLL